MRLEDILSKEPAPALRYLLELGGVSVLFIGGDKTLIDCNRVFMDMLGMSDKPVGAKLSEVAAGGLDGLSFPDGVGPAVSEIALHSAVGGKVGMRANVTKLGDGYLVFAEADPGLFPDDASSLRAELSRLKNSDPLTGLVNMEHFMEKLHTAVELAHRRSTTLSLMLCDIDNFKFITDTYGRDTADKVLVAFARIMDDNTRDEDTPARFRGDEFSLLLPHTDAQHGVFCAERMWEKVAELNVEGVRAKLNASFGVTQLKDGDTADSLIKRAETAVFRAKSGFPKNVAAV